jgi:hypothetical protein
MDPVSERKRCTMRLARYALAQELGTLPTMNVIARHFPALTAARAEICQYGSRHRTAQDVAEIGAAAENGLLEGRVDYDALLASIHGLTL